MKEKARVKFSDTASEETFSNDYNDKFDVA